MTRTQKRALWCCAAVSAALIAIVVSGGCSDPPQVRVTAVEAGCPNDLPDCGDEAPPSFATVIQPIMRARCMPCHDEGGFAADKYNFSRYEDFTSEKKLTTLIHEVYGCYMPPPDADTISDEQRAALLKWMVCRTPNN